MHYTGVERPPVKASPADSSVAIGASAHHRNPVGQCPVEDLRNGLDVVAAHGRRDGHADDETLSIVTD